MAIADTLRIGATRTTTERRRKQITWFQIWQYSFVFLIVLIFLTPLLWLALLSLRPDGEVFTNRIFPSHFAFANYARVFQKVRLGDYIKNSTILGLGTIAVALPVGSLAGYGFARWNFHGKSALLFFFIFALSIPGLVNLIPIYTLFSSLHLLNTYQGLILVYVAANLPVTVWLMRAYFQSVPPELEEAALIDGCSRAGALMRVTVPVASPGLAAAALLIFVSVWHEFIVAQTLISQTSLRVVNQGLFAMQQQYTTDYTGLAATAIIVSLPVVVLFIVLQTRFVAGLTAGVNQ